MPGLATKSKAASMAVEACFFMSRNWEARTIVAQPSQRACDGVALKSLQDNPSEKNMHPPKIAIAR